MISEKAYNVILGKVADKLPTEDYENLLDVLSKFEELLGIADEDDFFGTEGWKHYIGWEE